MTFLSTSQGNERVFNNADSFAMAFDAAWKQLLGTTNGEQKSLEEKLKIVLNELNEHPFLKQFPSQAIEVARFRIKLLNLT